MEAQYRLIEETMASSLLDMVRLHDIISRANEVSRKFRRREIFTKCCGVRTVLSVIVCRALW